MARIARPTLACVLALWFGACSGGDDPSAAAPTPRPVTTGPPTTPTPPGVEMPSPAPDPQPTTTVDSDPIDSDPLDPLDPPEPSDMATPIDTTPDTPGSSSPPLTQTGSNPVRNPRPPDLGIADEATIALLDRLATNDDGLVGFKARITYQTIDALLGRKETRTGEMIYHVDPGDHRRRFAAMFDAVTIGARKRLQQKQYVFDGRWLAEIDNDAKQFIKREIVAPGREIDPLKLGEGPFPLPIGQPRDEVLRRFDVRLIERPPEGLLGRLDPDVHGLLLTPRPGTPEAQQFRSVRLYFDRATLLPVGSHVVEASEDEESDESIVMLSDLVRNPKLTPEEMATLLITEPDPALWRIDVRAWEDR